MPGKKKFTKLDSPRDTKSLREALRELCASYGDVVRVRIWFVTKRSFLQAICFVDMKQKIPIPAALSKLGFRAHKSSFYISFHLPADFNKGVTTALLFTQQFMDSLCAPVLLGC
jgi:hypothetical protein